MRGSPPGARVPGHPALGAALAMVSQGRDHQPPVSRAPGGPGQPRPGPVVAGAGDPRSQEVSAAGSVKNGPKTRFLSTGGGIGARRGLAVRPPGDAAGGEGRASGPAGTHQARGWRTGWGSMGWLTGALHCAYPMSDPGGLRGVCTRTGPAWRGFPGPGVRSAGFSRPWYVTGSGQRGRGPERRLHEATAACLPGCQQDRRASLPRQVCRTVARQVPRPSRPAGGPAGPGGGEAAGHSQIKPLARNRD
ncbi:MAG: hypothetical protein QOJ73_4328 [Streptosporangiaceae bacterium]|jgi:hypothetical protein|nr:hypothetical protein [Streptosporangiaceae bacterium]